MLELFTYTFMVRALVVGVFTAVATAVLGNFVVASRQSVISDMLAHTALVGVGLGVFWQVSPTGMAFVVTVLSAGLLWWLGRQKDQAPEALSMLLLSGGLATALLLVHLNKGSGVSFDTYLFGSVLTVSSTEMHTFASLSVLIVLCVIALWRPFLTLVFEREFLRVSPHWALYELFFLLLIAVMVAIGMRVVGGLLIGALLVIPVLVVQPFCASFRHNVLASVAVNIVGVITGILASFYLDVPTSSGIVLSLVIMFLFARLLKAWRG